MHKLLIVLALLPLCACVSTAIGAAVGVTGAVAGAAIHTTGAVVGAGVHAVTPHNHKDRDHRDDDGDGA